MSQILALKISVVLYPIVFISLELCSFPSLKKKKKTSIDETRTSKTILIIRLIKKIYFYKLLKKIILKYYEHVWF